MTKMTKKQKQKLKKNEKERNLTITCSSCDKTSKQTIENECGFFGNMHPCDLCGKHGKVTASCPHCKQKFILYNC